MSNYSFNAGQDRFAGTNLKEMKVSSAIGSNRDYMLLRKNNKFPSEVFTNNVQKAKRILG